MHPSFPVQSLRTPPPRCPPSSSPDGPQCPPTHPPGPPWPTVLGWHMWGSGLPVLLGKVPSGLSKGAGTWPYLVPTGHQHRARSSSQ